MEHEALKKALEALKAMQSYAADERKGLRICDEAIIKCEEALANHIEDKPKMVAQPVAWRRREVGGYWQYFGWEEADMSHELVERWNKDGFECEAIPAGSPQREWVDLKPEDILNALRPHYEEWECVEFLNSAREDYKLISDKLKEMNT